MAITSPDNRGLRLVTRYLVLTLIALMFCFPLVFMIMPSFKPDQQLRQDSGSMRAFLPVGDLSFTNHTGAFARAPVGLFIFNSVLVTGVTVILSLLFCSLAGFSFTFINWRGRKLALSIIPATLIVPFATIAIPLLLLASKLPRIGLEGVSYGWRNFCRVQIVPLIADGLTIFLFAQCFNDLPGELIKVARVEGTSWWQVYLKIVMPLSGPVLAFHLYLQTAPIAPTGVKG